MTAGLRASLSAGRRLLPGIMIAALVSASAQFVSDHYGAPAMLMALLIGQALAFLAEDERFAPGLAFCARHLLRFGVVLLGLRISTDTLRGLSPAQGATVVVLVAATILLGLGLARLFRQRLSLGFLTGGSVSICGASAAMAIASILPPDDRRDRDLSFTVGAVTVMSSLAMIFYPVLAQALGLDPVQTGILLGLSIHDVAQVVGAGFSVSPETGEIATLFKLLRVAMLAPVVALAVLMLRARQADRREMRVPLLPGFILGFLALLGANAAGLVPDTLVEAANPVSRAALLAAVAAVGVRSSLRGMMQVGHRAMLMVVIETAFLFALAVAAVTLVL